MISRSAPIAGAGRIAGNKSFGSEVKPGEIVIESYVLGDGKLFFPVRVDRVREKPSKIVSLNLVGVIGRAEIHDRYEAGLQGFSSLSRPEISSPTCAICAAAGT